MIKTKTKVLYTLLVILIATLTIMTMTVPSKLDYNNWLAEKYGIVTTNAETVAYFPFDYSKDKLELTELSYAVKGFGAFIIVKQELTHGSKLYPYQGRYHRIVTLGALNHYFVVETTEDGTPVFNEVINNSDDLKTVL